MKAKTRKSPKPATLLTQAEALLSDVLAQLSSIEQSVEQNVREVLLAAEASLDKAKGFITPALAAVTSARSAAPRKTARRRRPVRRSKRAAR